MNVDFRVHLHCLDSPPELKHHIFALLRRPFGTFTTTFLSLISLIFPISVFLTTLPCLDSHRWGRLCHIADRWITRGNTCSTAGQCRFPWIHKYTNKHTNIHYIAPDRVYIYGTRFPTGIPAHQSMHYMQNVLQWCYYCMWVTPAGWNLKKKGLLKGNFIPVG